MSSTTLLQFEFLKPRYWLTWVGIGLIRLICYLPLSARWKVGSWLGLLAYALAGSRRRIVQTNIALCFPDLNKAEQHQMVLDNFRSSGIGIIETALVWFTHPNGYLNLFDIDGLEALAKASESGNGVLLLGMHLSTLDFAGAVLAQHHSFDVMYRRNKNKLLEAVMTRGRERSFESAIERSNVRQVIRRLREGAVVWYGPDQDYGRKHSIFAPFFNQEAASITATARIASMTGAPIIVFSHFRDLETYRYRIRLEAIDGYPTGDEVADCTRINEIVESAVRVDPAQYWWLHRRFKTRPEGEARIY